MESSEILFLVTRTNPGAGPMPPVSKASWRTWFGSGASNNLHTNRLFLSFFDVLHPVLHVIRLFSRDIVVLLARIQLETKLPLGLLRVDLVNSALLAEDDS